MARRSLSSFSSPIVAALAAACATLGTTGPEAQNLPSSNVGPFRKLTTSEVLGVAPYVLDGLSAASFKEPAVLPLDTDPASKDVALYVDKTVMVAGQASGVIVRTRAADGVSFYGTELDSPHTPELALAPSLAWEGASVHAPSVLRVGAHVFLFYAAAGGIGVAVSSDGVSFTKNQAPVLTPDPSVRWETTVPTAPSVAVFPDGTWHMLYGAGVSIGEATSADGVAWARVDGDPATPGMDPVLGPSAPGEPLALDASGAPFDGGEVADPCLLPRVTPGGRLQVRVLYTGYAQPPGAAGRVSSIGFAARYGDAGPLERGVGVVYAVGKHEAAPALFEWGGGELLYVQEDSTVTPIYTEIAAAVAPVSLTLPVPAKYSTSP